ncbi:MAG TPA: hypothetical protein VG674_31955 [Amycolatopsis sp.]|nr:hypothetical protein [Amycolatopsis sp.]
MAQKTTLEDALGGDEDTPDESATPPARKKPDAGKKPVKLTLEFTPEMHTRLKTFALLRADNASLVSLMRAAAVVMERDTRFGNAVIKEAKLQSRR